MVDPTESSADLFRVMLARGSTAGQRLVERLDRPDGVRWVEERLEVLTASYDLPRPSSTEGRSPASRFANAATLREAWRRANTELSGIELDLARFLLVALVADGEGLPEGTSLPTDGEDFLELASVVPEPWAALFTRNARVPPARTAGRLRATAAQGGLVGAPSVPGYRLLERLGGGGMSVVYRALQERTEREVAVKLLLPGRMLDGSRDRLRSEARMLARSWHPNVAQVLDLVESAVGSEVPPFLVLELVEGRSLIEHAEERGLGVTERLELYLQLAVAVQHAHEENVVHRDLHPGNVLVTHEGVVKVLDFGIARSLDGGDPHLTLAGEFVGTLAYCSPERVDGRSAEADERSDIYSLGVLLQELLTGRLPFDLVDVPLREAIRRICETAPRPLTIDDPHLGSDLEIIVGKALRRDPDQRYASVEQLAGDIRCFLEQRPIAARDPDLGYRMRTFIRRHRVLVTGVGSVLILLSLALAATLLAWGTAKRAEASGALFVGEFLNMSHEFAEQDVSLERREARLVFLQELFDNPNAPEDHRMRAARTSLKQLWGDLAVESGDVSTAWERRFEVVEECRQHVEESSGAHEHVAALSIALVKLGDMEQNHRDSGRAFEYFTEALTLDEDLAQRIGLLHYRDNLVWSYVRMGDYAVGSMRDSTRGLEHMFHAREEAEELVRLDPERTLSHFALSHTNLRLALILQDTGAEPGIWKPFADRALAGSKLLVQREPGRRVFQQERARALSLDTRVPIPIVPIEPGRLGSGHLPGE